MTSADATELDATLEIVTEYHQYYQELIVIIIMDTEIERVDIMLEISMISQYQWFPIEGNMQQVMHILAFPNKKYKLTLYIDMSLPQIDYWDFNTKQEYFTVYKFYYEEPTYHKMPWPWGRPIVLPIFVDYFRASKQLIPNVHTQVGYYFSIKPQ